MNTARLNARTYTAPTTTGEAKPSFMSGFSPLAQDLLRAGAQRLDEELRAKAVRSRAERARRMALRGLALNPCKATRALLVTVGGIDAVL
jgi:hypothetical protein